MEKLFNRSVKQRSELTSSVFQLNEDGSVASLRFYDALVHSFPGVTGAIQIPAIQTHLPVPPLLVDVGCSRVEWEAGGAVWRVPVPAVRSLGTRAAGVQVRVTEDPAVLSFSHRREIQARVARVVLTHERDVGSVLGTNHQSLVAHHEQQHLHRCCHFLRGT